MSEQINLKLKSLVELKSIAYDLSKILNQYSQMLNTVNAEIGIKEEEAQKLQQAMSRVVEDKPSTDEPPKTKVNKKLTAV